MKNLNEQLKNAFSPFDLSSEEKDRMREVLRAHIRRAAPVPSPYGWVLRASRSSLFSSVVALAVLLMTGTAYAAQSALPGDPLYAVKINVNEKLSGVLAVSPSAKAQWHAHVAQERVAEAEELTSQGKLTPAIAQQLEQNFDTHAEAAAQLGETLAKSDPAAAAQLQANFGASLQAQSAVLAELGNKGRKGEGGDSAGLAAHVKERGELALNSVLGTLPSAPAAASAQVRVFSAARVTAPAQTPEAATSSQNLAGEEILTSVKQEALEKLGSAHKQYEELAPQLDASTTAQLQARFAAADSLLSQGDEAASSSAYAALQHYRDALSQGAALGEFLSAGEKFRSASLLPSLLGGEREGRGDEIHGPQRKGQNSEEASSTSEGGFDDSEDATSTGSLTLPL